MRMAAIGFAGGAAVLQTRAALPQPSTIALAAATALVMVVIAVAAAAALARPAHSTHSAHSAAHDRRARSWLRAAALLLAGAVAGFLWAAWLAHCALAPALARQDEGKDIVIVGTIDSLPSRFAQGVRFHVAVEQVLDRHGVAMAPAPVPPRIAVSWYSRSRERGDRAGDAVANPVDDIAPGARWRLTVRLQRPHGNANPHGFDYEAWLLEQGPRGATVPHRTRTGRQAVRRRDRGPGRGRPARHRRVGLAGVQPHGDRPPGQHQRPAHHDGGRPVRADRVGVVAPLVPDRCPPAAAAAGPEGGGACRRGGGIGVCAAGRLRRARPAHAVHAAGRGGGAMAQPPVRSAGRAVHGAGRGGGHRSVGGAVAGFLAVVRRGGDHRVCHRGPHPGPRCAHRHRCAAGDAITRGRMARAAGDDVARGRPYPVRRHAGPGAADHAAVRAGVDRQPARQRGGDSLDQPDRDAAGAGRQHAAVAARGAGFKYGALADRSACSVPGMVQQPALRGVDRAGAAAVDVLLGHVRHPVAAGPARLARALAGAGGMDPAAGRRARASRAGPHDRDGLRRGAGHGIADRNQRPPPAVRHRPGLRTRQRRRRSRAGAIPAGAGNRPTRWRGGQPQRQRSRRRRVDRAGKHRHCMGAVVAGPRPSDRPGRAPARALRRRPALDLGRRDLRHAAPAAGQLRLRRHDIERPQLYAAHHGRQQVDAAGRRHRSGTGSAAGCQRRQPAARRRVAGAAPRQRHQLHPRFFAGSAATGGHLPGGLSQPLPASQAGSLRALRRAGYPALAHRRHRRADAAVRPDGGPRQLPAHRCALLARQNACEAAQAPFRPRQQLPGRRVSPVCRAPGRRVRGPGARHACPQSPLSRQRLLAAPGRRIHCRTGGPLRRTGGAGGPFARRHAQLAGSAPAAGPGALRGHAGRARGGRLAGVGVAADQAGGQGVRRAAGEIFQAAPQCVAERGSGIPAFCRQGYFPGLGARRAGRLHRLRPETACGRRAAALYPRGGDGRVRHLAAQPGARAAQRFARADRFYRRRRFLGNQAVGPRPHARAGRQPLPHSGRRPPVSDGAPPGSGAGHHRHAYSGNIAMTIKSDKWIRRMAEEHGMIEPFFPDQVRQEEGRKVISYGTSSYGYDIRCADEFKIFTNINSTIVDPKNFDSNSFVDVKSDVCIIPPNSFALARTMEYFRIPRSVLTVCLGKSTYARCGIIVNVTPFEPEWEGYVTLEFSNTTPLPAKIYAGEGCAQVLFFESDEVCDVSYKDRNGKNRSGVIMVSAIGSSTSAAATGSTGASSDSSTIANLQKQLQSLQKDLTEANKDTSETGQAKSKQIQAQVDAIQQQIAQLQAQAAQKAQQQASSATGTATTATSSIRQLEHGIRQRGRGAVQRHVAAQQDLGAAPVSGAADVRQASAQARYHGGVQHAGRMFDRHCHIGKIVGQRRQTLGHAVGHRARDQRGGSQAAAARHGHRRVRRLRREIAHREVAACLRRADDADFRDGFAAFEFVRRHQAAIGPGQLHAQAGLHPDALQRLPQGAFAIELGNGLMRGLAKGARIADHHRHGHIHARHLVAVDHVHRAAGGQQPAGLGAHGRLQEQVHGRISAIDAGNLRHRVTAVGAGLHARDGEHARVGIADGQFDGAGQAHVQRPQLQRGRHIAAIDAPVDGAVIVRQLGQRADQGGVAVRAVDVGKEHLVAGGPTATEAGDLPPVPQHQPGRRTAAHMVDGKLQHTAAQARQQPAAAGAVAGPDGAAVRLDDVLGDGQPQAVAFRAGIARPEERLEDGVEVGRRHARSAVEHADDQLASRRSAWCAQLQLYLAALRTVLDGVAHHVFDGAAQQVGLADHDHVRFAFLHHAAVLAGRFIAGVVGNLVEQVGHADVFLAGLDGARFEPRQREQLAHQFIHAHAFAFHPFHRRGHLQPGLAIDQAAQAGRHAVEVAAQVVQFGTALAAGVDEAGRQVAAGGRVERLAQGADRPRKIPGQQEREQQAGQHCRHQRHPRRERLEARTHGAPHVAGPHVGRHAALDVAGVRLARLHGRWRWRPPRLALRARRATRLAIAAGEETAVAGHAGAALERHLGVAQAGQQRPFAIEAALAFRRRQKQQEAVALRIVDMAHHAMPVVVAQQRARFAQYGRADDAPQQFVAVVIDRVHAPPVHVSQHALEGAAAAEFQRGGCGVDRHFRGRAGVDIGLGHLLVAVLEPDGAADGNRTAVGDGAELVTQAGQVDVDIAVETGQRASQALFGQRVLADRAAGVAGQDFQQVEFGAGQFQLGAGPGGAALLGPHGQLAHHDGGRIAAVGRHALGAAQDGADAGRQLARGAGLGHVIVGAQFQADDAVGVVAAAGQHQDGQLAVGADAAQRFQAVHARHHDVEDGDGIRARAGFDGARFAVMHGLDLEAFLFQVFLEHADQFDVVVYQQYFALHVQRFSPG
uniref:DUF4131 domain-containing protein n=1 Tax=Tanacetum cinerariifolium TaxID=118510 RepID=A0A699GF38_TANCI|nr:hypothetical protein [Tanacetum cinerariifolium]